MGAKVFQGGMYATRIDSTLLRAAYSRNSVPHGLPSNGAGSACRGDEDWLHTPEFPQLLAAKVVRSALWSCLAIAPSHGTPVTLTLLKRGARPVLSLRMVPTFPVLPHTL